MANSKRKCPYCKESQKAETMFIRGVQAFCSKEHYIEYQVANKSKLIEKGKKIQNKEARAIHKKRKESLKKHSEWLSDAQKWFNRYIRLRDKKLDCISCSKTQQQVMKDDGWKVGGAWDCGHYLTRGARPELRFNEDNAHKQCKSCNGGAGKFSSKSATVGKQYRERLIKKIGLDRVEYLECEANFELKKPTIEELKEIIAKYKAKCKEIE